MVNMEQSISSSMDRTFRLLLARIDLRSLAVARGRDLFLVTRGIDRSFSLVFRDVFQGIRHPVHGRAEVRKLDECEQEADDPVNMLVREQGYQSEHRHELELQLLSFVRHSFRQR